MCSRVSHDKTTLLTAEATKLMTYLFPQHADRGAHRWALLSGLLIAVSLALQTVSAVAQSLPLIRDTEIERLLNDYANPIFRAAGLGSGRVDVRIVNNRSFNAFVVDGRNVFMHTGTLMESDSPNQVIGVLAHEAGHIAGGHMAALRARIKKDQTRALIAQILGIGAMIGGATAGGDSGRELGTAGQGIAMGGTELIMRGLTAERRSQEAAADQAGLAYLNATQQSGEGMLETFERFAQQEYISDAHKDSFVRTHPVARDRLARLRKLVKSSPYANNKDGQKLQFRHDMMRAKLFGYIEDPSVVFNRYPRSDTSLPARYARAVAMFRRGGRDAINQALRQVDGLLKEQPSNPYFWEMKGDLLQKAGRPQDAIAPLRKASQLLNNTAPLINVQLAQVMLQTRNKSYNTQVIKLLRTAIARENDNPTAYNLLGQAYHNAGKLPQSYLARAQGLFYFGAIKDAQNFAKRAQVGLPQGSAQWLVADDIIRFKLPK
jgi:predicted Zn-dependent protease